jgi:hypothetical protein
VFRLTKGRIFITILVESTCILRFSCLYVCGKDGLFNTCAEIPAFDNLVAVRLVKLFNLCLFFVQTHVYIMKLPAAETAGYL